MHPMLSHVQVNNKS